MIIEPYESEVEKWAVTGTHLQQSLYMGIFPAANSVAF